ncbi:MAG: Rieske (2Fe-2S) protein [Verrucomicrobia bacterium]|nr:Rieske (2Fe-2S) protein [Verrucomicrobiota bacterium]
MNGEPEKKLTRIGRRRFLALLTAGLALVEDSEGSSSGDHLIDAGPSSLYTSDGIYDKFRDHGFFLVRKNGKLVALSAYCTHRICKLTPQIDHTFACKCHGSKFSEEGKVTEGPAKRDLPVLPISATKNGHLIINVSAG